MPPVPVVYDRGVLGKPVYISFLMGTTEHRQWYRGVIQTFQRSFVTSSDSPLIDRLTDLQHEVHFDDGDVRWFDLAEEERGGRLKWDDGNDSNHTTTSSRSNNSNHHNDNASHQSPNDLQAIVQHHNNGHVQPPAVTSTTQRRRRSQQKQRKQLSENQEKVQHQNYGVLSQTEHQQALEERRAATSAVITQEDVVFSEDSDNDTENEAYTDHEDDDRKPTAVTKRKARPRPPAEDTSMALQDPDPALVPPVARAQTPEAVAVVVTPEKKKAKKKKKATTKKKRPSNDQEQETNKRQRTIQEYMERHETGPPNHNEESHYQNQIIDINDFEHWLRNIHLGPRGNPVSDDNAKGVVRQVKKFMTGDGISYRNWPDGVKFYENRSIDLSHDFDRMLQEAKDFQERYGRDKGNGWLLNHPIMKLKKYKEYLQERQNLFLSP